MLRHAAARLALNVSLSIRGTHRRSRKQRQCPDSQVLVVENCPLNCRRQSLPSESNLAVLSLSLSLNFPLLDAVAAGKVERDENDVAAEPATPLKHLDIAVAR